MPAIATLEELVQVQNFLDDLKKRFPDCYTEFQILFRKFRPAGYKNICKLLLEETTPRKLKGLSEEPEV